MIPFEQLGCGERVQRAFARAARKQKKAGHKVVLGRVTSLDRGFPLVRTQDAELRAELATTIKKSEDSIVAVGDWVALGLPSGHEKAIIGAVLPRRTEIARVKRVGREGQLRRQVLAANVDTVFICQSLTGEGVDCRLLVRQMAAVAGSGAAPVFLLTKSDLVDAGAVDAARTRIAEFAPDVPLIAVSSALNGGIDEVRALAAPQTTSLLLGESGVGKSSLVNALVGKAAADVGAVRAGDDKGRHTTVARRMLAVPGGGVIIDAPGLRTLQILDLDASLEAAFPDIAEAALDCKFRDCSHTTEPGCAVREQIAAPRLAAYRYLVDTDWR